MDDAVNRRAGLTESDVAFLRRVERDMGIVADISRADMLIYCPVNATQAVVVAQVKPHSILPIYPDSIIGRTVTPDKEPYVFKALRRKRYIRGHSTLIAEGAPIVQEVHPLRSEQGRIVGALSIETNLLEHERHRRRSKVFQRAVRWLQTMLLRGELVGVEGLSPFGEHDGIIIVDAQRKIRYVSGIATNLYRKLGYMESLIGRSLFDLETVDEELVSAAIQKKCCLERGVEEQGRILVKKVIPLLCRDDHLNWLRRSISLSLPKPRLAGVLLTIHDETEERRKEQELKVKSAMIQELHHRVKNNLQTIASLLRLQGRRVKSEEARRALQESISRILSVAVVHEFLSQQEARVINIYDVSQRIIDQMRAIMDPSKRIKLNLEGPNVHLPTQQATACALIINELLQNAVEHGYEHRSTGVISIELQDEGDRVIIAVEDDGRGLPQDFSLDRIDSLGLQIVQTLVRDDLEGEFELEGDGGMRATVTFPK